MVSFHGKIGWKGQRRRENKNNRYVSILPDGQEKIQKFKITVMASFQAKIGWKILRK